MIGLPRPNLEGDRACMRYGPPWWRRLHRQVVPRRRLRGCCCYHSVDWALASKVAISALASAGAESIEHKPGEDPEDARRQAALDVLRTQDLAEATMKAARSLFVDPIQPQGHGEPYWEGRHRTQAMLDAGVRRTVVVRMIDPGHDR